MFNLVLSFVAGIVVTVTLVYLYSSLKHSQLAELIAIALRNRWASAPTKSPAQQDLPRTQAEKERAMVAGMRPN